METINTKYKNLAGTLKQNKVIILYVFVLNILLLIPSILSPIFKQVFTDYVLTDGVREFLPPLLLLMAGTACFSAVIHWMKKNCLLRLSNKIELSGASKYMWTLFNAPLDLFDKKDSYQLLSKSTASKRIAKLLTRDLLDLLFNVVSVVFYLIMMIKLDPLMSAVVVGLVVVTFLMTKLRYFISEKME